MTNPESLTFTCPLCHADLPRSQVMAGIAVHGGVLEALQRKHPAWTTEDVLCLECFRKTRASFVASVLEQERGEISALETELVRSLREHELVSRDVNRQTKEHLTLGQRVADIVARFGGSWYFIGFFGLVMAAWIGWNASTRAGQAFDPYPFILLNLILSTLAALQAPVIMMSQNRQEEKDRVRAENDYLVNIKAELEIRQLHDKIDQLITRQWQRLLEIQRIQTELLDELSRRR